MGTTSVTPASNFSFLIAPEPRLDADLTEGHQVIGILSLAGFIRPRLYCNTVSGSGAQFIPEKQIPMDDAPWVDTGRDLLSIGVPLDLKIYLQYYTDTCPGRYFDVAQAVAMINAHDQINGLERLMAIMRFGSSDSQVLQIVSNLANVRASISDGLAALKK